MGARGKSLFMSAFRSEGNRFWVAVDVKCFLLLSGAARVRQSQSTDDHGYLSQGIVQQLPYVYTIVRALEIVRIILDLLVEVHVSP